MAADSASSHPNPIEMLMRPAGRRLNWRPLGAVLLLSGCSHGDSFTFRPTSDDTPLNPLQPIRLTYSPGEDQYPSWSPDGSGIFYSFVDSVTGDRCVGRLPGSGGQVSAHRCPRNDPRNDSLDLAIEPSAAGDGAIAWIELHSARQRQVHDRGALLLGSLDPHQSPEARLAFPYLATTGTVHLTAAYLRWLPNRRLAYIGTDILIRSACFKCKPDSIAIGREAMVLDLSVPGSIPVPIPGTSEATSIWPTADSSGLYYTLAGDTRVWRGTFDGQLPVTVHDFGTAGIVRDVSVAGGRLAAIIGGKVQYGFEEALGLRQIDSGGTIATVDLSTGEEQLHPRDEWFRRPVLSPDGRTLVVEVLLPFETHPDLWLFRLPRSSLPAGEGARSPRAVWVGSLSASPRTE